MLLGGVLLPLLISGTVATLGGGASLLDINTFLGGSLLLVLVMCLGSLELYYLWKLTPQADVSFVSAPAGVFVICCTTIWGITFDARLVLWLCGVSLVIRLCEMAYRFYKNRPFFLHNGCMYTSILLEVYMVIPYIF